MWLNYRNGQSGSDWPGGDGFKQDPVTIDIAAGVLSVSGDIANTSDFQYGSGGFDHVTSAKIIKNGAEAGDITIKQNNGAVSSDAVSVGTGDAVALWFTAYKQVATTATVAWGTVQTTARTIDSQTVAAGSSATNYTHGDRAEWDLRVWFDGATGNAKVELDYTALPPGVTVSVATCLADDSSANSTTKGAGSTVTHTASFGETQASAAGGFIMEVTEEYGGGISRVFGIKWLSPDLVPAARPTARQLHQVDAGGYAQVDD